MEMALFKTIHSIHSQKLSVAINGSRGWGGWRRVVICQFDFQIRNTTNWAFTVNSESERWSRKPQFYIHWSLYTINNTQRAGTNFGLQFARSLTPKIRSTLHNQYCVFLLASRGHKCRFESLKENYQTNHILYAAASRILFST